MIIPTTTMELDEQNDDEELLYVDLNGKQVFIIDDIPLVNDDVINERFNLFKVARMVNGC